MKIYFIVCIVLFSSFLYAGEIELIYSEGTILQKEKNKWIEIEEGDMVSDVAIIRLEDDALAEFEGKINDQVIFFSIIKEGTYNISNFITPKAGIENIGLVALIGSKVDHLLNTLPESKEVSMGARASERETVENITWDDAEDYLIDGILELENNNFDLALYYLEQSLANTISVKEEPEINYYISLVYYRTGLKAKALKTLAASPPDPEREKDEYFYNDYVLLCGFLYAYSKNHQAAIDILESAKEEEMEDQDKQALYLIRGMSFLNIENKQKAEENLKAAIKLDPDSISGKNAAHILKQL